MTSVGSVDISGDIPRGYCQCGCGEKTNLAQYSCGRAGWVKGEPVSFRSGHHNRLRRKSNVEYIEEDRGYKTPCWIWQLARYSAGYGSTRWRGKQVGAHVRYYEERYGPLPDGLQPDHLCRQRPCVNPDHMEPVTSAENTRRGSSTKLEPWQVRAARRAQEEVGLGATLLARNFSVTKACMDDVLSYRNWKDLA